MRDWRKVMIAPEEPIARAVELLNFEALRIVLVVDENQHLLGTVTDGDVRRGMMRHLDMAVAVKEIMFTSPKTVPVGSTRAAILALMKTHDILQIPLLDETGVVMGLETLQHITAKPCYENPVFLMAGGFGKRLRPLTHDVPKPLLKVGSKPILQTILESFVASGFRQFYISTHYRAEMLREHFGDGSDWNVSIEYVHEEKPLGTAGSLGLLPHTLPELPLIIMNGDLLTKINFEQLLRYHEKTGGIATMCVREYDLEVPYGVVAANEYRVENIIEKPVHTFFVNAGIYVINPELYRSVDGEEFLNMPDLLQSKIEQGVQINMFPIHEYWLDIGRPIDFEQAHKMVDETWK